MRKSIKASDRGRLKPTYRTPARAPSQVASLSQPRRRAQQRPGTIAPIALFRHRRSSRKARGPAGPSLTECGPRNVSSTATFGAHSQVDDRRPGSRFRVTAAPRRATSRGFCFGRKAAVLTPSTRLRDAATGTEGLALTTRWPGGPRAVDARSPPHSVRSDAEYAERVGSKRPHDSGPVRWNFRRLGCQLPRSASEPMPRRTRAGSAPRRPGCRAVARRAG